MRSSTLSALAIAAVGVNAASIARRDNIVVYTPDQGNAFFQTVVNSLQTSGDLRNLTQSFQNTINLFVPGASYYTDGDFYINGTTTAAQAATFCGLIPKYAAAGSYATDTLIDSLPQTQDADEEQAIFNMGSTVMLLSDELRFLTPLFNNSGALPTCDKATQNAFLGVFALFNTVGMGIAY
ncbi:hypothetical protein V8C35DRAFT_281545 [Trichoderma chlorosporum]